MADTNNRGAPPLNRREEVESDGGEDLYGAAGAERENDGGSTNAKNAKPADDSARNAPDLGTRGGVDGGSVETPNIAGTENAADALER